MLTQREADHLIRMRKAFVSTYNISIPSGTDQTHELIGDDKREQFLLDIWRGSLRLSKLKYQNRGRNVIVLLRLDIDGSPHTNPDGTKIDGSHLHVFREGYEDKWAYPINPEIFQNTANLQQTFENFCLYCNIDNMPPFQGDLL